MSHADVNGVSLYYEEHGSGEPLVLLHGGLGAGAGFEAIMPALCANRRVIAVDLQGHGGTADVDRPLRPETMSAATWTASRPRWPRCWRSPRSTSATRAWRPAWTTGRC
jgi:pimeloyl-ACP methyl ester carboxylesterase